VCWLEARPGLEESGEAKNNQPNGEIAEQAEDPVGNSERIFSSPTFGEEVVVLARGRPSRGNLLRCFAGNKGRIAANFPPRK
jgi:hypothetical protein